VSKSNAFEADILKLIFNGVAIGSIADNAATSPLTDLYVALHTADPGDAGTQTSSECAYTGYARVAVERSSSGWTVTDSSVSPAEQVTFGSCTAGTETATHFSVGTASSGTGKILYSGALSDLISISTGVQPFLTTSTAITED
jgi:hypothetical protein